MKKLSVLPLIALLPLACGDETAQALDDGDTGGAEDSGGSTSGSSDPMADADAGTSGGSESSGGSAGSSDSGPDPEDLPPPPATGIEIVAVTADQGARVPIYRDGALVGGTERNAPLLQNRNTVIRAFYEVDPGFATRDIYGVLHLESGGTEAEFASFITASEYDCEGEDLLDCRYQTLPHSFYWHVPAEHIAPDTNYWIELFETKPGHENDVSDKNPVFPGGGDTLLIGVEDSYAKMRVVIVPFDHDIGPDCAEPPDLNEVYGTDFDGNERTIAEFFGERLLAHNPADEVEMIVHDVVPFTGSMQGSQLLGALQELRYIDGAPPEYYYYGVARPCDGGPDFAGVAQLGGPSKSEASQRVGWGVYYSSVGATANTFVHEIGHEQGRRHIACSGEAGVDPSYPGHPDGDTLSWGIDVINNPIKVYSPFSHDYMTYCGSTWVSEWGWNKVYPWIVEISSWELEGPGQRDIGKQPLLIGTVYADGSSDFYVAEGWFDPSLASNSHAVSYAGTEGVLATTKAMVRPWERTEDLNVIAPLPQASAAVSTVIIEGPNLSLNLERAKIRVAGGTTLTAK